MGVAYEVIKNAYKALGEGLLDGDVYGIENIPQEGAALLACNHASYFDPPWVGGAVVHRRLHFFARKTLFKPGLGERLMNSLNCIPVDRDGDSDVSAFKRVINLLKQGEIVGIFPEGTRTRDGLLQPAKRGVGLMACKANVPVIPVRLWGTFEAWPKGTAIPCWGTRVTMVVGRPLSLASIDPGATDEARYQTVSDRIMGAIASLEVPQPYWE